MEKTIGRNCNAESSVFNGPCLSDKTECNFKGSYTIFDVSVFHESE